MFIPFLPTSPMKELYSDGGGGRGSLHSQDLSNEIGRDAAELVELGDYRRSPAVAILAEGVEDEASNRGKATGSGERETRFGN